MLFFLSLLFLFGENRCFKLLINGGNRNINEFERINTDPHHQVLKEKTGKLRYFMVMPNNLQKPLKWIAKNIDDRSNCEKEFQKIMMLFGTSLQLPSPNVLFFLLTHILECNIDDVSNLITDLLQAIKGIKETYVGYFHDDAKSKFKTFDEVYNEHIAISRLVYDEPACSNSCLEDLTDALQILMRDQLSTLKQTCDSETNMAIFDILKESRAIISKFAPEEMNVSPVLHLLLAYCGFSKVVVCIDNPDKNKSLFFFECPDVQQSMRKLLALVSIHSEYVSNVALELRSFPKVLTQHQTK